MTFDADAFMNSTVNAPMSTSYAVCPPGEFLARIGSDEDSLKVEGFPGKKDPTKTYVRMTILWEVIDESVKAQLKRDKVTVRQQFFLDFDVTGGLSTEEGRNVDLGRIRKALGRNEGAFTPGTLRGAGPAKITVVNTTDEKDAERKYAEVSRVTPL